MVKVTTVRIGLKFGSLFPLKGMATRLPTLRETGCIVGDHGETGGIVSQRFIVVRRGC
jgi:hypothetical protein